jgi:hypothetical protein
LIAAGAQERQKLLAGDIEFSQRERLHGHGMLRAFGIKAAGLMHRATHQEFSRWNANHLRALRTFGKCLGPGMAHRQDHQDQREAQHQGMAHA